MQPTKQIHLYIEKQNRNSGELILDFLDKREFVDFVNKYNKINYQNNIDSIPCLIFVSIGRIPRGILLREGGMLTVGFNRLLKICLNTIKETENKTNVAIPPSFLAIIKDADSFLSLLKDPLSKIQSITPKSYKIAMDSVWKGSLQNLSTGLELIKKDNVEIVIWDVGQGSASAVISDKCAIIYDLGCNASSCYDIKIQQNLLRKIKSYLNGIDNIVLILSHWDCDHYNLLYGMDDNDMKKLKLVLFSTEAFGQYAERVYSRIRNNCKNRYWAIAPSSDRKITSKIGIELLFDTGTLQLFRGEYSTSRNRCGLLLSVKCKKSIMLLGGDHTNYQIWKLMYSKIGVTNEEINAVAPHHGSLHCLKLKLPQAQKYGVIAVSAGNGNSYSHPDLKIVTEYINSGFIVKCTEQGPKTNGSLNNLFSYQKDFTIIL